MTKKNHLLSLLLGINLKLLKKKKKERNVKQQCMFVCWVFVI
jgi:hypothetical protein